MNLKKKIIGLENSSRACTSRADLSRRFTVLRYDDERFLIIENHCARALLPGSVRTHPTQSKRKEATKEESEKEREKSGSTRLSANLVGTANASSTAFANAPLYHRRVLTNLASRRLVYDLSNCPISFLYAREVDLAEKSDKTSWRRLR